MNLLVDVSALVRRWFWIGAVFGAAVFSADSPNFPKPIALSGIENAFQLSPRVYSGGEPDGEAAFTALAKQGIRTVVSVDGARPDLETARRHGLRYVHLRQLEKSEAAAHRLLERLRQDSPERAAAAGLLAGIEACCKDCHRQHRR